MIQNAAPRTDTEKEADRGVGGKGKKSKVTGDGWSWSPFGRSFKDDFAYVPKTES
jgi:hypothetical protein